MARWLLAAAALLTSHAAVAAPRVLDDFEDASRWTPMPASGVLMQLSNEPGDQGRALRVDVDFQKGGGYAVLRREVALELPANYRFAVRVRGATGPQNFELKLVDPSGENVWWRNRVAFEFPATWQTVATRKRQITFAWGPAGGGEMKQLAAIEFAITAGSGGKGTVWLDELTFEELPPPTASPPPIVAEALASAAGHPAARAVDGNAATAWRPGARSTPRLTLDLGVEREFGGLAIDWNPDAPLADYIVSLAGADGRYRVVRQVRDGGGGRDWIYLPESEARWVRIEAPQAIPRTVELREVSLLPIEQTGSMNGFYEAIAKAAPRGQFPRGIRGEMQFWTVVGTSGGREESFMSQDGAVDLGTALPSIEPFLWSDNRLWTWADVKAEQALAGDRLPMPSVTWHGAPVELEIRAIKAADRDDREVLQLRYRILNRATKRRAGRLLLTIRPFQVNPPSQFLNKPGGVCGLREVRREGATIRIDTLASIACDPLPEDFAAMRFEQGDVVARLAGGRVPGPASARDPFGHASGVLAYPFNLDPGDSLVVRLESGHAVQATHLADSVAARWRRDLGPARITLPPSAREVERSLAAQIGWIAINRDGPAIQPGSRAYARSWIRDGSLTSSALLRWGRHAEVRAFLEWFAPFQYDEGKVPCCVDWRGSDPVPEHDSHGEFIYLAAEYFRHTGDTATVRRLWPHVARAAAYQDTLRAQRLGAEWRAADRREFFGILPPSISHEGYSAKPMHSYWDDFWALRGYEDAVFLARLLGRTAEAQRLEASLTAFRRDFGASIAAAREKHKIAFVPGCADLGDFDATSTTIALSPVQGEAIAPPGAIEATFEKYWETFTRRRDGKERWEAFTPYEIRNIGAFVRLGWRDRAQELLAWFLDHRSPAGWAQWAEVVWNDPPGARFVGDIPHTWVGSDFVRAVLDMLAYERERDEALVIGAGVPEAWLHEGEAVAVSRLNTWYGDLSFAMRSVGEGIRIDIEQGLRVPPGGLVIAAPGVRPGWRATVNGKSATVNSRGEVIVRAVPATVALRP